MAHADALEIQPEVLALIPADAAVNFLAVPVRLEGNLLTVVFHARPDRGKLGDLEFLTGRRIRPEVLDREEIATLFRRYYRLDSVDFTPSRDNSAQRSSGERDTAADDFTTTGSSHDTAGSVVSLANRIIADAIRMKASDIHIEPYEKNTRVRYRIDGMLHEVMAPSREQTKPLISRLKIMADLDIAEKRRPQDGRIRVKSENAVPSNGSREGEERTIDIRVSSLPTDFGEKIVLRILDKSQLQLDLGKLGFEETYLSEFRRTIRLPYGMVLVTGPTGSGKTTTLYAALNEINRPEINITTIEDPIEYNLDGINQTHVRAEIGVTFAAALRSILRQDPNVIMVGEIRDAETAEIAIRAALTGHLVVSTLHTNDAPSAVTRLIDMGIEPFLVASSVKMILAQRLLRRLCDRCRKKIRPDEALLSELGLGAAENTAFYGPGGCSECNNFGYKGRTAVYEVLKIHNGFVEMITHGATAPQLREAASAEGMMTLRRAALEKAKRGETSLEEVIRETV